MKYVEKAREKMLLIRGEYVEKYVPPVCEDCKKPEAIYLSHGKYFCREDIYKHMKRKGDK